MGVGVGGKKQQRSGGGELAPGKIGVRWGRGGSVWGGLGGVYWWVWKAGREWRQTFGEVVTWAGGVWGWKVRCGGPGVGALSVVVGVVVGHGCLWFAVAGGVCVWVRWWWVLGVGWFGGFGVGVLGGMECGLGGVVGGGCWGITPTSFLWGGGSSGGGVWCVGLSDVCCCV